jgi:GNAT superfamily N-acetyltransferase
MHTEAMASRAGIAVRPLRAGEEPAAAEVLTGAFGRWPADLDADPVEHFRWKHLASPLGPSLAFLAEVDGRAVGFAAWMPCALTVGTRAVSALRGVDLGVHPDFRGRGVAAALTPAGATNAPPGTAFNFTTPNQLSRSGVLRQGRRRAGELPVLVRFRRPLRAVLRRRSRGSTSRPTVDAPRASEVLADGERVAQLLAEVDRPDDRLSYVKDRDLLRWRYGALAEYHALPLERGGDLAGIAVFRLVRHGASWSTRVCELLVRGDDLRTARRLLRQAVKAADTEYATCHFEPRTMLRRAAVLGGFLRSPSTELLLVYPLVEGLQPDPTDVRSWSLTLGDLELF